MFPIKAVTGLDLAFPAHVLDMMPSYEDCAAFRYDKPNKWTKLAETWFMFGIKLGKVAPKPGVDQKKAFAHVACILRSFEPKHEHKIAAAAFLLNEWFDDVEYTQAERKKGE